MTALEKFVSCIIEEAEKAPPNTSIADLMGSMGWVNKQAEQVSAVQVEREACAQLCASYTEWCLQWVQDSNHTAAEAAANECADAIRARGRQTPAHQAEPVAEPVAVQADPILAGYESMTPVYTRWISPSRYAKFSDAVKRWYRPYWLPADQKQAEPVVEAYRALVVEALPTALVMANYLEAETVGLEDIAAKLRRLDRLEKVVKAVEDGESFEVLEKLAADFRKGLK